MSSISATAAITCECGEQFESHVWSLVQGDQNEELRQALLCGELNLVFCPLCGKYFHHEMPVVYFDQSMDLLVFILPSSYKEKEKEWVKKMREDFELLRTKLLSELKITSAPVTVFGMEAMQEILREEISLRDESEVIAAIAAELELNIKPIIPIEARIHGVPLSLPYAGSACDRESLAEGVDLMLKEHDGLLRLKKLAEMLQGEGDLHFIL